MAQQAGIHPLASRYINLANPRLGAAAVLATDDFFAPCERMLKNEPPIFIPGKFDDNGKWMDGWESRRKRTPGHDWCVVRLAMPGIIRGVNIDTSHFIGNHPPHASLEACHCPSGDPNDQPGNQVTWREILPRVALNADSAHWHEIHSDTPWTHVRLHIYPDGGVARLRVYGDAHCDWSRRDPKQRIDLFDVFNGGRPLACSHEGFGSSMFNLNLPGRGVNMGDGWETPRRRGPGHDWVVLALGHAGRIDMAELDTAFYKGNFPDRASIDASLLPAGTSDSDVVNHPHWTPLLTPQKLAMDAVHRFDEPLVDCGTVSHVRVNIFPDGGLSRVRLWGYAES